MAATATACVRTNSTLHTRCRSSGLGDCRTWGGAYLWSLSYSSPLRMRHQKRPGRGESGQNVRWRDGRPQSSAKPAGSHCKRAMLTRSSRQVLQGPGIIQLHLGPLDQARRIPAERRLLRLPGRQRRARHIGVLVHIAPLAAATEPLLRRQAQCLAGAAGLLLQKQGPHAGLRTLH